MKTVYACVFQEDALVVKSMLESTGMACELLSGGKLDVNPLFNVDTTGFTVVVPDEFEADAKAVVADFMASSKGGPAPAGEPASAQSGESAALNALAARFAARAVHHRRALHAIPEAGLDLPRTTAYIRQALAAAGVAYRDAGGGIVADLGTDGPLVAVRADMDALPVTEETGLPFASGIPGYMHACGHDAHAGTLLAAAEALKAEPPVGHRVRLIFQPGEEGFFGARFMIEAGCLDGVSAIVAGHVGDLSEELEPGQAGFMPGPMMAASDRFDGAFVGSGGHGSAPHHALDPIPALAQFVLAAQTFRNRRPDQRKPFVVSICQVSAGTAYNVIPGRAEFKGTARTLEPAERELARTGLEQVCRGAAMSGGVDCEFRWLGGYPPLSNDPEAARVAMDAARSVLGDGSVRELTVPSMGGEDFAYYLEKVPGCFWFLNTQVPERDIRFPNHHARFDLDESMLERLLAVNLAAAAALARAFGSRT